MTTKHDRGKLTINKKTIAHLSNSEMNRINGGGGIILVSAGCTIIILDPHPDPWKPSPDPWIPIVIPISI